MICPVQKAARGGVWRGCARDSKFMSTAPALLYLLAKPSRIQVQGYLFPREHASIKLQSFTKREREGGTLRRRALFPFPHSLLVAASAAAVVGVSAPRFHGRPTDRAPDGDVQAGARTRQRAPVRACQAVSLSVSRTSSRYRGRCTWTWLRPPSLLWVGHWLGSIHTRFHLWCHSLVCWSTSAVFLQKGSQGETWIYCMCSSGCHRYNSHHHRGSCTL